MEEKPGNQCQFYLERKKRFCRFRPRPGEQYCPEHSCILGIQSERKRIPCPLNPKHNCYEDDLQNHLKKCPVAKRLEATAKLDFYVKDINLGTVDNAGNQITPTKQSVKELTDKKLKEIISRVNSLYSECVEDIDVVHLEHGCVKEHIAGDSDLSLVNTFGGQAILKKELLQQASLVGQLDNEGFLSSDHCFVELGAGKGKLSHWIQIASKSCTNNSFVLVDRSSVRYKMDSYHKGGGDEGKFHRIKIDIRDLCLGKVPEVKSKSSVVVIGKHLCGGATDMGIRCAVDTLNVQEDKAIKSMKEASSCSRLTDIDMPNNSSVMGNKTLLHHATTNTGTDKTSPINVQTGNCSVVNFEVKNKYCDLAQEGVNQSIQENEDDTTVVPDKCIEKHVAENLEWKEIESPPCKVSKVDDIASQSHPWLPHGIMIALCCHHQCTWDTYAGRDFMKAHAIGPEDFDILTRLSSWATCARVRVKGEDSKTVEGEKRKGEKEDKVSDTPTEQGMRDNSNQEDHDVEDLISTSLEGGEPLREKLSISQREEIGRKCKRIIDMGRIHYLRSKGMSCFLREYVDERQTPENIVLLAKHSIS